MWTWRSRVIMIQRFSTWQRRSLNVSEKCVCDPLGFLMRCSSESFNLGWFLRSSFWQYSEVHRETWVLENCMKLRVLLSHSHICGNGRQFFRYSIVLCVFIILKTQIHRAAVQCMICFQLLQNSCSKAVIEILLCGSEDFCFTVPASLSQVWIWFAKIQISCNLDFQAF